MWILFVVKSCEFMQLIVSWKSLFFLLKMIHRVFVGNKLKSVTEDHLERDSSAS